MNSRIKEAVMAAFVADALSLGVHWVYETADIEKTYGRLDAMVTPQLAPYHKSKRKGEFTHYGDQMMVLLASVTRSSGFDLSHFCQMWQTMFDAYTGYMDQATKDTLANIESGKTAETSGSMSFDLGGAARIAPLALYYSDDVTAFVGAAISQTKMTHNQRAGIEAAEFFARTASLVLTGLLPGKALQKSLEEMPNAVYIGPLVKTGIESRSEDTRSAIGRFGQMCSVQAAFPSAVHLIARYENDLKEALIENCMAGGDSSARGMLAGFIIGCHQGLETIPGQWLDDMAAHEKIMGVMG